MSTVAESGIAGTNPPVAPVAPFAPVAPVALIELLDRDGHVRQSVAVAAWPLRVGRAIDNQLVLDDPHTAPHHFVVDADDAGVYVQAGDTRNGLRFAPERGAPRRLAAGERAAVGDAPLRLDAGDSHLRLRLAAHALAPERPLAAARGHAASIGSTLAVVGAALALLVFLRWLDTDPDLFTRALGSTAVTASTAVLAWCGAWALVSKVFTRRSHFFWHLRVLLLAVIAAQALEALANLAAFALSWPWVSDYAFVLGYAAGAAMVYFHVLGIEPRRPRRLAAAALGLFVAAIGVSLWFNRQANDQFGEELYMSHLFPPALRLARPLDSERFLQRVAPLQGRLDELARRKDSGSDDGAADDDE